MDGRDLALLQQTFLGILFAEMAQEDADRDKYDHQRCGKQCRNAEGADHEGVRAEKLNEGSSQTVPGEIPDDDLAVIFSLLIKDVDPGKADDVPEGFIEKRRMHVHRAESRFDIAKPHSPGHGRFTAEGFTVAEVAPSAHCLTEHNGGDCHVAERKEGDLLSSRHIKDRERAENDTAVDGKTAVPYSYDVIQRAENVFDKGAVRFEITSVKDDEIKSRTDDRGHDGDECDIQHIVKDDSLLLCTENEITECCENGKADDQTVPHDGEIVASDVKGKRHAVQYKFIYAEPGKRNDGFVVHWMEISFLTKNIIRLHRAD